MTLKSKLQQMEWHEKEAARLKEEIIAELSGKAIREKGKKYRKWTIEEKHEILALKDNGATNEEIAKNFNSTVGAITGMLSNLKKQK